MSSEMTKRLAQAQAIRELGIGSDVSAKSFDVATQKAKNDIGSTDFVGAANTQKETTTAKSVWDMQKKKEDQVEKKRLAEAASIKRAKTKKEYDDYINSAEYEKKRAEREKQYQIDRAAAFAIDGFTPKMADDPKEMQLRAARDQAEAEYNAAEDRKVIEQDLEAITGLSAEERRQLEQYATGRDVDFYESLNFAQTGDLLWTQPMGRAEKNAAGLIEKYGEQRVNEMANTLSRINNEEMSERVAAKGQEQADNGFLGAVGASAASVPAGILSGIGGVFDFAKDIGRNDKRFNTLDPNALGNLGNVYSGAVRGQVGQNISDLLGGGIAGQIGSGVYQGVMSAADSIARAYMGGGVFGGAALAATDSFSQTMADASRQGATPAQAALLATTTAGIEALSEKFPLDNLIQTAKGKGAKTVIANALRQMGIEATTEEISLLGTVLAEAAILQEKSTYQQDVLAAIGGGATPEEAILQASRNVLSEALNTALVSMVSGGVSSLGGSYADARGMFAQQQEQTNPVLNRPNNAQQAAQTAIENNRARQERMAAEQATQEAQLPQTETQPVQAAQPQTVQQAPQQTQQPQTQQNGQQSLTDIYADMFTQMRENNGKATNKMANAVMNDPTVMQELGVSQEGSKADQRRRVKEEMENLFLKQNEATQTAQNIPETEPMQATEASEQATTQASTPTTDMQMGANNQSAEGGQQAETQPETPKMQRDRINSVRDQAIPESDIDGRKNSEAAGNIYTSSRTPDSFAENIRRIVNEGRVSHDVQTNEESLNKAAASIAADGSIQNALNSIKEVAKSGRTGALDVAKGVLIYDELVKSSDSTHQALAEECFITLTELATNTGRPMQLFSLFRKMTPESQLRTMERAIQRNVERFQKNGSVKKDFRPVFNQELEQNYLEAARDAMNAKSDQARQEAEQSMQELQNAMNLDAAAQMPATFKAKWDAWRYMAMLGNVKTQLRNVVGNAAFVPYKLAKDKISAVAEKVFVPKSQRTKSIGTDFGLVKWAQGDAKTQSVNDALKYSAKLGDDVSSQKFQESMQVFDIKGLEWVRKKIEGLPQKGDILFKNGYYAHSLAGFLRSRGYTAADIQNNLVSKEILNEGRAYAINEAMKATFNDCNAFSDGVAKIGKIGHDPVSKALNYVGESILPFRRTPANILVRFKEYSPFEILRGVGTAAKHIRNGDISAATAIDQMASGLTGTALATFGYFLAAGIGNFKLTGRVTDEDEKRQGHQAYALEFSIDGEEYSYKIDWAAPANLPLFVGANIYQAIHDSGGDTSVSAFTSFLDGAKKAVEPMLALSCMSSLNDLIESVRYGEEGEAAFTIAAKIATNYFTQGIPSLARQATQAFTENKQTTFTTSDDPTIRDLQSTAAGFGVGNAYKTDKVTAWGEKENQGNLFERSVNAFLNPGTLKRIDNSEVEQEINRLNDAGQNVSPDYFAKTVSYIDKDGNRHDEVRLTEEQYQTLAQTQGQTARKLLEDMFQSASYQGMNDEQKAEAIKTAYQYARMTGEIAAIGEEHTGYDQSWMYDVEKGGANEILRRELNSGINTAMGDLDNAWDKGYDEERFVQEMENMFRSYQNAPAAMKKQVYAEASGTAKRYIEVRDKGISHTDALSAIKNVATVKGTGSINKDTGKPTVRDIDRRQAIANTTGLSAKEIDTIMKAYMSDYDPNDESPETTEFKYQYAREELGLSPKEYAATYRAYLDNSRKAQKIKAIRALGYDYRTANALYKLYYGRMKNDLIEMYG